MMIGKGFVKALLCRVPYRFVMALLGIEMALTRSGEAGISGVRALIRRARAVRRSVEQGQSGDKRSKGRAKACLVSALNSKPVEWQSIGTDMYSFGIARH